jgi:hypothetical protein
MTKANRIPPIGAVLLGILCPLVSASAQQRPPIADEIAKTHGFDSFGQIDAIRYTFHIDLPGLKLARSWIWEPKTDQITYEGPGKDKKPVKVTYKRSDIAKQSPVLKVHRSLLLQRSVLAPVPVPPRLGHGRDGGRRRDEEAAAGQGFCQEGRGEVSTQRWLSAG